MFASLWEELTKRIKGEGRGEIVAQNPGPAPKASVGIRPGGKFVVKRGTKFLALTSKGGNGTTNRRKPTSTNKCNGKPFTSVAGNQGYGPADPPSTKICATQKVSNFFAG